MKTNEFIYELVENGLDNSTIIDHVEDQDSKYLELLHTELGFLTGIVMALESGVDVKQIVEKRIQSLRGTK